MEIQHIKQQLYTDPEVLDRLRHRAFEIYLQRRMNGWPGSQAEDWLHAESQVLPSLIQEIVERNRLAIDTEIPSEPVRIVATATAAQEIDKSAVKTLVEEPKTELPPIAEASAPAQAPAKPVRARKPSVKKAAPDDTAVKTAPKRATKKAAAPKVTASSEENPAVAKKAAARDTKPKAAARVPDAKPVVKKTPAKPARKKKDE